MGKPNATLQGAGTGAVGGAAAGSMFGPWGALIGGGIGAGLGAFAGGAKTPTPPQPQPDALAQSLAVQAGQQQLHATQLQATGDQASLLARYGTRLALSGSGVSPLNPAARVA